MFKFKFKSPLICYVALATTKVFVSCSCRFLDSMLFLLPIRGGGLRYNGIKLHTMLCCFELGTNCQGGRARPFFTSSYGGGYPTHSASSTGVFRAVGTDTPRARGWNPRRGAHRNVYKQPRWCKSRGTLAVPARYEARTFQLVSRSAPWSAG